MIYTNTRGEIILFLITKKKIPEEFEPVTVTFEEGTEGKMAVIENIVVVQVSQSQKAWCSASVTNFFAKTCLFEVKPLSTICNYDKARGHLDVLVSTQIRASGRVPLETAPEISKHTQANDLFINAAFQSNLHKVATKFTIAQLFEARIPDPSELCSSPDAEGPLAVAAVVEGESTVEEYDAGVVEVNRKESNAPVEEEGLSAGVKKPDSVPKGFGVVIESDLTTKEASAEAEDIFIDAFIELGDSTTVKPGRGSSSLSGDSLQTTSRSLETSSLPKSISNLSLETQVKIIAEAAALITHRQIIASYEKSGMWLSTDGSEDYKLSSGLVEVLRKANENVVPSADSETNALTARTDVDNDECNEDDLEVSKLFEIRTNMVMRKEIIDDNKSSKTTKARGTDKSFRCSYCGKTYASYYTPAARSHDFERGGFCPKQKLEHEGVTVPSRQQLVDKNMFFRLKYTEEHEVVQVEDGDLENPTDDGDPVLEDFLADIDDDLVVKIRDWKFVISNLNSASKETISRFIRSLGCQGIVETVDRSVTHVIMGTESNLRSQRTTKYLMGVAAGRLIVSYEWIVATLKDSKFFAKSEGF